MLVLERQGSGSTGETPAGMFHALALSGRMLLSLLAGLMISGGVLYRETALKP